MVQTIVSAKKGAVDDLLTTYQALTSIVYNHC